MKFRKFMCVAVVVAGCFIASAMAVNSPRASAGAGSTCGWGWFGTCWGTCPPGESCSRFINTDPWTCQCFNLF